MSHAHRLASLLLVAAAGCSGPPAAHRLGDYSPISPLFSPLPSQKTPTELTVNLTQPAYVAVLYVVPGRGAAIVYPVDSSTNNRVDIGAHTVPLHFAEMPLNRDSLFAAMRRGGGRQGPQQPPQQPPQRMPPRDTLRSVSDSAQRDSGRVATSSGFGPIREPSPAASPIGYLLLAASSDNIPFPMLRKRVEGVTIPIDDDEALSTVMKLVKASTHDGSTVAGYAQELLRR